MLPCLIKYTEEHSGMINSFLYYLVIVDQELMSSAVLFFRVRAANTYQLLTKNTIYDIIGM